MSALLGDAHCCELAVRSSHSPRCARGAKPSIATKHAVYCLLRDLYSRNPGLVSAAVPLPIAPPPFATAIAFRNGPLQSGQAVAPDRCCCSRLPAYVPCLVAPMLVCLASLPVFGCSCCRIAYSSVRLSLLSPLWLKCAVMHSDFWFSSQIMS